MVRLNMSRYSLSRQPTSFREVMSNPKKDYADGALALFLLELENWFQMKPDMLADLLHEYALLMAMPKNAESGDDAVRFYCQLQRFRDNISEILNEISAKCEDIRNAEDAAHISAIT